jgi:hypothetical protein
LKTKEFESYLDKSGFERIRVKLKLDKGEVTDVVYQYESYINGKWMPIVRYDCSHGFFHRDLLYPDGGKEKYSIGIDDLKVASKYAEQDLKDRWEWYRERFNKKMKKH